MLYSFLKLCSFFRAFSSWMQHPHLPKDICYSFLCVLGGGQLHLVTCRIVVSQPGIEPGPVAVKVPSLKPWTTREFCIVGFFFPTLFLLFHHVLVFSSLTLEASFQMPLDPQLFIFRSEALGTHFVGGHGLTVGGFHCKVIGRWDPRYQCFCFCVFVFSFTLLFFSYESVWVFFFFFTPFFACATKHV